MLKILLTVTFIIIIFQMCVSPPLFCQEPESQPIQNEAQEIFMFAEHLFAEGEYYRAITEYMRLLFLYPEHPRADDARLQIGNCYMKGEQWDAALTYFQSLLTLQLPDKITLSIVYNLGKCYYAKAEYDNARIQLTKIVEQFPDTPQADQARYLIGQSYLKQDEWLLAADEFAQLKSGIDSAQLSQQTRQGVTLPYKSPGLAGGLSAVLPGSGQLYTGHKQDALMAFLLNGVFIWGIVESFRQENEVAGGILLFFELGWYGGNIFNAVNSAHKYNKKLKDDFRDSLDSRFHFNLGNLQGNKAAPYLGLSYSF